MLYSINERYAVETVYLSEGPLKAIIIDKQSRLRAHGARTLAEMVIAN